MPRAEDSGVHALEYQNGMLISLDTAGKKLSTTQAPSKHRYSRSAVTLVVSGLFVLIRMPLVLLPKFRRECGFVAVTGVLRTCRTKAWTRSRNV